MRKRVRLGMLTPSSNTSLESLTFEMLRGLPEVSAHFGRFSVTEISLRDTALGQFDNRKVIEAAKLLADAKVDVIAWNGTSAGWLGMEADVMLCKEITAATGIPATTSTLALQDIMKRAGKRTLGMVAPYLDAVMEKIIPNFGKAGMDIIAERHLNISVNWDFCQISEEQLTLMVRETAAQKPDAITTFCTNLRAAHLVQQWETETGIPVYDTVTTAVWRSLVMAGVDTRRVKGWGGVFALQ